MRLKEIAHARTGDKGEISNISVIPYREADFAWLKEELTAEKVKAFFAEICHGEVVRYELEGIKAFNFVMDRTLGGGVTRSLALDKHGKTLGMALLEMEVETPEGWTRPEVGRSQSQDGPERAVVRQGEPNAAGSQNQGGSESAAVRQGELNAAGGQSQGGLESAVVRRCGLGALDTPLEGKCIRIGSGAGYAGDRLEPALELLEKGDLDYLIFECLAERTVALGQQEKEKDSEKGYNPLLEYRMRRVLPLAAEKHVKIITNMGAANPESAAEQVSKLAGELGLSHLRIAYITGDDITDRLEQYENCPILENGKILGDMRETLISANAYMGAEGIVEALSQGADIIITGRVSDPALTVGPLLYEFGWNLEQHPDQMGQAILAGHLLECAGQVTGGYYASPGYKEVPDLAHLGFPIIEIDETGGFTVSKVEGSGGLVSTDTCKEQTVYEIHNPAAYLTPDAIADFTKVRYTQIGKDQVYAAGATSHGKPDTLKVSVGYKDCWIGEGEISYGGGGCLERAKLAAEILEKRIALTGISLTEYRTELIGWDSLYRERISEKLRAGEPPCEVRLRVSGRSKDRLQAELLADEVEALYTNGPAGGGGAVKRVSEIVSVCSIFVPRTDIRQEIHFSKMPGQEERMQRLFQKRLEAVKLRPITEPGSSWTEMVPMADGIRLETVICLPRGRGPWPIILKRSCYPNQQVEMDWYADVFTCRGFGLVYQWCRGTAGSEGDWEPNVHERADGLATVEWLTGQPYTKNIGFWGDSYLGLTGWCMLDAVPESVKSMYLGVYGVDRHTSAYKDGLFRQDVLTTWAAGNTGSAIPEGVSQMDSCRYRPQEEVDEKLWGVHLDWYRDWISHPDRSSHYWSEGFWGMLKEIPTKAKIPVYIRDGWYDHHLGSAIVSYDSLSEESKAHSVLQIGPWNHGYIPVIPFEDTKNLEDDALDSVFQWFYETLVKEKKPEGAVREYVIGEDRWIEKKERAQCTETRSFYFGNGTLDAQPGQDGTLSYEYDPENPVPSHGTEAMLAHSEEQGSLAQPQPGARPDVISFVSEPLAEGFTTDGVIEVVLYAASDAEDTAFTAKVMEVFPDGTAVNVRGSITTLAYRNGADKRLTYMPGEKVELRIPMWDIAWHFREGSRIRVDISSSDFPQYAVHSNYPGVWSKQSRTKIAEQTLYYGGGSPSEVRFPLIKK